MIAALSPIASRSPFKPVRPWVRRAVVAGVVGLVVFLGHGLVVGIAQGDPLADVGERFSTCITGTDNPDFQQVRNTTTQDMRDVTVSMPDELLEGILVCSLRIGSTAVRDVAWAYWWPLLIVMTVWFGVTVMFGGFDPTSVIAFVMRVGFAAMIMGTYYFDDPTETAYGTNRGFVWVIAQQGIQFGQDIVGEANEALSGSRDRARAAAEERDRVRRFRTVDGGGGSVETETDDEDTQSVGLGDRIRRFFQNAILYYIEGMWRVMLWVISWIVYAQFLWGFVGLSVLAIVGPLFIPFMIVTQLEWLFWGWLRSVIQTTIYMMMAGVVYVVVAMLMLWPLEAMAAQQINPEPQSWGDFVYMLSAIIFPYAPALLVSLIGVTKVGAASSALMSGSGMPGAGLGSSMASRAMRAVGVAASPRYRSYEARQFQERHAMLAKAGQSAADRVGAAYGGGRQSAQKALEKWRERRRQG